MAGIPQFFPEAASNAIASYDAVDLAEGAGRVNYLLANTLVSGSALTYFLTRSTLYSGNAEVSGSVSAAGLQSDTDFDLTYNLPQNLKGTVYVNVPHYVASGDTASQTHYLKVKLRRWDGTTETEIASEVSKSITGTAGVGTATTIHSIPIVISGVQKYGVGETLRITIEDWCSVHGGGTAGTYAYGIDPADRTSDFLNKLSNTPGTSKSTIFIPFKLDP